MMLQIGGTVFMLMVLYILIKFNHFISYVLAPEEVINDSLKHVLVGGSAFLAIAFIVISVEGVFALIPSLKEAHIQRLLFFFFLFVLYLILINVVIEFLAIQCSSDFKNWRKSQRNREF